MNSFSREIARKIIWLRTAQIEVNERYKAGDFLIPIHLALGHESVAVAIDDVMTDEDALVLTHRNIHFNLARLGRLRTELDEYYLKTTGLAKGRLGSMNLSNSEKGIVYSSSILGNNLSVATGFALGAKVRNVDQVVFVTTGDGAIEEGSFYENLLMLKSQSLPCVIMVENNGWSLGTHIKERRSNIDLRKLCGSLDIDYGFLRGNDPYEYVKEFSRVRTAASSNRSPCLVEIEVTTLGHWIMKNEDYPRGKYINYHAGPAPEVTSDSYPVLEESDEDPLYVLTKYFLREELEEIAFLTREDISDELS